MWYSVVLDTCCFNSLYPIATPSWWRHQNETFSALLAICAENSPVPGEFPGTKASDAELWCFSAATKQLYEWFSPSVRLSVCPSVCPSVCHTFLTMFPSSYHHEIFRSYYQWQKWRPCKRSRSKVKVTEVTTQLHCFRTVTPVWIHIWWWDDAYSLIMLRRGALLFFKVIRQISRSHGFKNCRIWPRLGVSGL